MQPEAASSSRVILHNNFGDTQRGQPGDRPQALKQCVEETMQQYFRQLDGQPVTNIYDMVLSEVEAPLLAVVMRVCQGNQCKAAEMMGLSRGTLRKKLQQHGML